MRFFTAYLYTSLNCSSQRCELRSGRFTLYAEMELVEEGAPPLDADVPSDGTIVSDRLSLPDLAFLGVLCSLLAVWLSPYVMDRVAPFLRPAARPVAPQVLARSHGAALDAAQAKQEAIVAASMATAEAKRLAKLEADAASVRAEADKHMGPGPGRAAGGSGQLVAATAEQQGRAREAAMEATAARHDALLVASRERMRAEREAAAVRAAEERLGTPSRVAATPEERAGTTGAATGAGKSPAPSKPPLLTQSELAKARRSLAAERLWPEPAQDAEGAVFLVLRSHDGASGETRTERRFSPDAPLAALLDAVQALCPGGLAGRGIATVMPRAVVAGWGDYDVREAVTEGDFARLRAEWEAAQAEEAGASGGVPVLARPVPPTALPAARRSLKDAGLAGRVQLVVRPLDADRVTK
jgi:hypothetical protein